MCMGGLWGRGRVGLCPLQVRPWREAGVVPISTHLSLASPSPCLGTITLHSGLWSTVEARWACHPPQDHIPWQKTQGPSLAGSWEVLQSTGFSWALGASGNLHVQFRPHGSEVKATRQLQRRLLTGWAGSPACSGHQSGVGVQGPHNSTPQGNPKPRPQERWPEDSEPAGRKLKATTQPQNRAPHPEAAGTPEYLPGTTGQAAAAIAGPRFRG